jgi:signal transduction histidine kinase
VPPELIGQKTAQLVLRILNGEDASKIAFAKVLSPLIFEWPALRRFGISETMLPAGSEVRYRQLTVWEQYLWQIVLIAAVLMIQTILIVRLVHENRRRRNAETTSRGVMAELANMNRVATAGEMSASIAHEIGQPLGAIVAYAGACKRWLTNTVPNLDEARVALEGVISAGHRASEVVASVRAMFKKDAEERVPLDLNDLLQGVLGHLQGELEAQAIEVQTGLTKPLPWVLGHSGQLQQVIVNLVRNAADAMEAVSDRARVLRVKTAIYNKDGVLLSIADTGNGIDPKDINKIFESFFTTKSQGMGMGLSICRSIIETHGGRLSVPPELFKVRFLTFCFRRLPAKSNRERSVQRTIGKSVSGHEPPRRSKTAVAGVHPIPAAPSRA